MSREFREEFLNPFDMPPFPNMIRVGFGREEDLHCEIMDNGEIQFFGDPMDLPVLTLKPDDWEIVKFMASHLEHYFVTRDEREPVKAKPSELKVVDKRTPQPEDKKAATGIVKINGKPPSKELEAFALK